MGFDETKGLWEFKSAQPSQVELNSQFQNTKKAVSVAHAIVKMLEQFKVNHAFGILGGAITPLVEKLENSSITVHHYRHESGAAFAACEAYFASEDYSGKKNAKTPPVAVFATTGPGLTNTLTGLFAARGEGAKIIFLSGATYGKNRGRLAAQETSTYAMPSDLLASGTLFDYAKTIEAVEELPEIARRLAKGLEQPGGFIANINIPTGIQTLLTKALSPAVFSITLDPIIATKKKIVKPWVDCLSKEPFVIWIGFGARHAAKQIRKLAEETGAKVICSPRGKGIFSEEEDGQFLGVTGFGGHAEVLDYMYKNTPKQILVLGSNLGEFTSFWNPDLLGTNLDLLQKENLEGKSENLEDKSSYKLIYVNPDQTLTGLAYPETKTYCISSEIRPFVKKLRKQLQKKQSDKSLTEKMVGKKTSETQVGYDYSKASGLVNPALLMEQIQEVIINNSTALVMAEPGNSFAWAINRLKFSQPGRFRTSTCFASMGHMTAGVVGAAEARKDKAVAIVGDGSMLMNGCEVSTAVKYNIPAVWIVLNDSRYNMCEQGMALQGFKGIDVQINQVNFEAIAKAMGAESVRVTNPVDVKSALEQALASDKPFVVDVAIDPSVQAPIGTRIQSLVSQGSAH
ncbi:thiamine pyrophosphate-dependent enzyme [Roseofilum sp. Guam]|uniref:thiamine pyrophosphate-dependent enzyme n=1 Tax=Roseofilum sp. Guam TaxID=2821502 RepID=UPI001B2746D4|nr:thiamine pyrophosphate-dependent enzyme [Roseofilum sp. Guam]MBP0027469.1 thiamine pyrophosphate-binding protein [Roseofilum sp. Guam]